MNTNNRYEWADSHGRTLYVERLPDGVLETNAGPDDLEAHAEVLHLAERVRVLEARVLEAEHVPDRVLEAVRDGAWATAADRIRELERQLESEGA